MSRRKSRNNLFNKYFNSSFFFANKKVLNDIYNQINNFNEEFKKWAIETPGSYKFIFNYAIVKLNNYQEIDITFNLVHQYHGRVEIWRDRDKPRAIYKNKFINRVERDLLNSPLKGEYSPLNTLNT